MRKHVHVSGLLDWQMRERETIDRAEEIDFQSLLTCEELPERIRRDDEALRPLGEPEFHHADFGSLRGVGDTEREFRRGSWTR